MLRFQKLDSRNEMKEVLGRSARGFWELTEPEYHCAYYVLNYRQFNDDGWFGVGIFSMNPSSPPQVVAHSNDNGLLIVHDRYISVLNLHRGEVRFSYDVDSVVYFSKYYKDTIVVIDELSVTQLSMNGEVLASYLFDDILESFSFEDDFLICQTMGSSIQYKLIDAGTQ